MMYDTCEAIIAEHHESADFDNFKLDVLKTFGSDVPYNEDEFLKGRNEDLVEKLYENAWSTQQRKAEMIATQAYPVIKDVYENKAEQFENIVVPFTDGTRVYQVITNLKKAYETKATELNKAYQKVIILVSIDDAWKEHLRELDDLRRAVQNASYEQKDPLLIYKFESFNLFKSMMERNNKIVVSSIAKGHIPIRNADAVKEAQTRRKTDLSNLTTQKDDYERPGRNSLGQPQANNPSAPKVTQPIRVEKKVGRNDPCPCGSGKKFKQCHGHEA
jgi:preprotein translocase subunit SecA